jgi:hypothetical protein
MHSCDFSTPEFEVILGTLKYPFHPQNSHIQGKVEGKDLKNSPPSCVLYQVVSKKHD